MVSFTSITQGAALLSILLLGLSNAAPVKETNNYSVPHINGSSNNRIELPAFIPSRIHSVSRPAFKVDLNAEADNVNKNLKWYTEHGGKVRNITKRDTETIGGMTMELSTKVPPSKNVSSSSVVKATSAQIKYFTLYAGLSSTVYCRGVVPLGNWKCKNCLKYVPDGKLIVTFSSLLADSNGFVLRSDSQKTIHLVFRGTNSIRSAVVVRIFIFYNFQW